MKRFLRWCAALVAMLVLAWALAAWFDWLPLIDARQRAALEVMRAQPVGHSAPQIDALPRVWLLIHRVPEQEWPALMALPVPEMVGRLQRYPAPPVAPVIERDNIPSLTLAASSAEDLRKSVMAARPLLRHRDWLYQADGLTWPDAATLDDPFATPAIPDFHRLARAFRQVSALAFIDGEHAGAQAQLCASADFWRRLMASADDLFTRMVSARMAELDVRLLAQMRAATNVETPACAALRLPDAAELDLCPDMRTEFRLRGRGLRLLLGGDHWLERLQARLFWDPAHIEAMDAQALASHCTGTAAVQAAATEHACGPIDWTFDPGGCFLVSSMAPGYITYAPRLRDYGSVLRLAVLAEWLRTVGDPADVSTLQERFEARPPELREHGQSLRVDAAGAWLEFTPHAPQAGTRGAPVPVRMPAPSGESAAPIH